MAADIHDITGEKTFSNDTSMRVLLVASNSTQIYEISISSLDKTQIQNALAQFPRSFRESLPFTVLQLLQCYNTEIWVVAGEEVMEDI